MAEISSRRDVLNADLNVHDSRKAGHFFLTNDPDNQFPAIDLLAFFGTNGDLPVGGDWDGDGKDSIGVWRPSTLEFFLSNDNGSISNQFIFGSSGDRPVVGDWDGKPNQ